MTDDEPDLNPEAIRILSSVLGSDTEAITESILEAVVDAPSVVVHDIQTLGNGDIEVWLNAGLDGGELAEIQHLYDVREVGVYGDPELAGTREGSSTDGKFHMVLSP